MSATGAVLLYAVDFGEEQNTPVVCLVEAAPGAPAAVTDIPISSGRRLRTLRGTLAELTALAAGVGEDYLRVYVRRLRDKLGDNPEQPRYIRTERGLGYRFIA